MDYKAEMEKVKTRGAVCGEQITQYQTAIGQLQTEILQLQGRYQLLEQLQAEAPLEELPVQEV